MPSACLRATLTHTRNKSRMLATAATARLPKGEGSIADKFTSLTNEEHNVLPERFADVKRQLWNDSLIESWRQVLEALEPAIENIASQGSNIIPSIEYEDIVTGMSQAKIDEIKRIGTVIISGAVGEKEATQWKHDIVKYAKMNEAHVRGFPSDNIQVFEIYNSKPQTEARTHPHIVNTQRFLLSLWNKSDPTSEVSLQTPISYFDRLRIRQPGDSKFTLGPHVDGGSVERWEDPGMQRVFANILKGGSAWKDHNPFDATPRIGAKQDMYSTSNACSIFRAWQGWTAMSSTGPGEGTLRVLPMLSLASAYILLRPFFKPRISGSSSLRFEDWVPDLDSPTFPGSSIGKTQELNERTHPHLQLARTMVSVPHVKPGDQVYWHCDTVHAVESQHQGKGDSSVMYIPAVPLTVHNANYLRDQRINFTRGLPPPDFPGGAGETEFVGRARPQDILNDEGLQLYGLRDFALDHSSGLSAQFVDEVNRSLSN